MSGLNYPSMPPYPFLPPFDPPGDASVYHRVTRLIATRLLVSEQPSTRASWTAAGLWIRVVVTQHEAFFQLDD
jgi:hypothetical protein